jgi:calcium permeable stress-gated cation channel
MPIYSLSDEETLRIVGLDAFMFLRYLKIFARLGVGCGIFGLITLVPIYGTASKKDGVVGIAMYSMAQISPGGGRLWASLICYWGYTLLLLYLLYSEYEYFSQLRQKFMKYGDSEIPPQRLLSVIVENVPTEYRSSTKLKKFFENLFPDEIYCAKMGLKYEAIMMPILEERKAALSALENSLAAYEATDRTQPPMIGLKEDGKPVMLYGGTPVAAIPFWEKELDRLNKEISKLCSQAAALDDVDTKLLLVDVANKPTEATSGKEENEEEKEEEVHNFTAQSITATGFITFKSTRAHVASYQLTSLHDQYPALKVKPVDSPNHILWQNIDATLDYIRNVSMLTKAFFIAGLIFWAAIIAFIASVSQISTLEKYLPFLKKLDPVSYSLLQGQLPVIILIIFISLLPIIFASVAKLIERRKTQTEVELEVFNWYFLYQIVNVYLLLLAGSVFGALADLLDNPLSIVNLLAESLPTVATFFLNYFITLTLSGGPLLLLRIVPLIILKLYRNCFNSKKLTLRILLEGPLAPASVNYSLLIPSILYPVCISLLYMVIAPILFAAAGIYFLSQYLVWKYQFCYILVPSQETGGVYWFKMFQFTLVGIMTSNITMIGYMALKQGIATTILLLPLPFLVNIFWGRCHEKFYSFSLNLSYCQAVQKDAELISSLIPKFSVDYFLPKGMITPSSKTTNSLQNLTAPYPYRLNNIDLLDEKTGFLNEVYYDSKEEGMMGRHDDDLEMMNNPSIPSDGGPSSSPGDKRQTEMTQVTSKKQQMEAF